MQVGAQAIMKCRAAHYPFQQFNIFNFFSEEHFEKIMSDKQIFRSEFKNVEEMIDDLIEQGYGPQPFPGCITSIKDYINFINDPQSSFDRGLIEGYGKEIIEGYGLTMRLKRYDSEFLSDLVDFFGGENFISCITSKFGVTGELDIETAIQKNLHGYEISPHCDTRKKALTYMANIYTSSEAEAASIHTHLLKFKPHRQHLYDFWRYNSDIDTCWVPWDWCDTVKETKSNNSIIIFKPDFNTLHAVKLNYDHLKYQRNQIYGNLWYKENRHAYAGDYNMIDLITPFEKQKDEGLKSKIIRMTKSLLDKI